MTRCEHHLRLLLEKKDFIPLCDFIDIALYHPDFGYYMHHQPLGSDSDFITAPEVSLLFGETLCFWAINQYHRLGQPEKIALVELGPGRGLLMGDFLRVAHLTPHFDKALEIHLLEKSPVLQATQRALIQRPTIFWHQELDELLEALGSLPALMIANEFFDALPIQQFQKTPQGWKERGISLGKQGTLTFTFKKIAPPKLPFSEVQENMILESCPLAEHMMEKIVKYLHHALGAALVIDYGYSEGHGDTLQAVSRHRPVEVLKHPGTSDITAHVNFKALKDKAGENAVVRTQAEFLMAHGIIRLAQIHAQKATAADKEHLTFQLYKLTSSQEMGSLFKVLEVVA